MSDTNSKLVQLRVPQHLLDRWETFITQNAIPSRTAFIINACNHYMLNFNIASKKEVELGDLKAQYDVLSSQMGSLLEKMEANVSDEETTKEDPRVRAQVLNFLEAVGSSTSDTMHGVIGVDHALLLDILVSMKRDGLILVNKDQAWSVSK